MSASVLCGHCGGDLSFLGDVRYATVKTGGGVGITYPADRTKPVVVGDGGMGVIVTLDEAMLHQCGSQTA